MSPTNTQHWPPTIHSRWMTEECERGLVSVIVPTYNRATRLPRAVESCLTQTHALVEVIVVDDGSSDDTPDVLLALERRWGPERFRGVRQSHQGACVARNRGLDLARGEFVQFLDSDDLLLPDKFSKQIAALRSSGCPVAVCDFQYVSEDGDHGVLETVLNSGDLQTRVASNRSISVFAPLFRADSIKPNLRFNPAINRHQDMDFMVRYFLGIRAWLYTPGVWCQYVVHRGGRISDTYHLGAQHTALFRSLHDYFLRNGSQIPAANWWMVRQYALAMSRGLLSRGDLPAARRLAFFALGVPFDRRRWFGAWALMCESFTPGVLLNAVGRLGRRHEWSHRCAVEV